MYQLEGYKNRYYNMFGLLQLTICCLFPAYFKLGFYGADGMATTTTTQLRKMSGAFLEIQFPHQCFDGQVFYFCAESGQSDE